jgi:hypothetical protein
MYSIDFQLVIKLKYDIQNMFHIKKQNKLKNIVINVIIHKTYLSLYKNTSYKMKIYGQSLNILKRGRKQTEERNVHQNK